MAPSLEFSLDKHYFWHGKEPSTKIDVHCMLPNGILISFPLIRADTLLDKIKKELWKEASRYSLFHLLRPKDEYVFVGVSSKGGTEELIDEEQSLFDVKPVRPYLKVVQKQGDEAEKKATQSISMLIGRSITSTKNEEVSDFRKKRVSICETIAYQRGRSSWSNRAIYSYPPEFEEDESLPPTITEKLKATSNRIHLSVSVMKNSSNTFEVLCTYFPKDLIDMALRKRAQTLKQNVVENSDDYILKVHGRLSFFLGHIVQDEYGEELYLEKHLIQYKYIRECLLWDKKPKLVIIPKSEMVVGRVRAPTITQNPPPLPRRRHGNYNEICLWDISPSTMLRIKVVCALNVNAGQMWKEVQCGLFHGGEEVCEKQTTTRQKGIHPCWNEFLEFPLSVSVLPRMARLCFYIIGYQQKDTRKKKPVPIAWVNIPVFNYKGMLNSGSCRLYCWQSGVKMASNSQNFLNPLGTVASSGNENGPCIVIEFMNFVHTVVYPSDDFIFEIAAKSVASRDNHPFLVKGGKQHRQKIEEIIKRDSLASMFEEDKELLWKLRAECCHDYPNSLPKLLQCVKWHSHEDVAQIRFLLHNWRREPLEVEIALDLLDYKFPDNKVRSLAVEVLDNLSDGELEMYLLQLVQALKFESYLDSPLAGYLLRRALNNRRIGHYLFWHLKAEVSNPECSLQFGLLLEMYCRGAVDHIPILLRQVEAIGKMKTVTEILQSYKDQDNVKKLQLMRECFNGSSYIKAFSNIISPLDPSIKLKCLRVEKCKYMSSKKKPLWLVFENADEGAEDVLIIFKNGDDLRQDMLTLLSLRLMDNVWKKAGYDYGIIPYRCLSTGSMVGLIEVVPDSETLGRIQASRGSIRGVWKEDNLYQWLQEHCKGNGDKLDTFMGNFMRSVVGYSVATYVLGVGDRHNDNIMMKYDTGQLFHIDFGHFLGNFKSKFGIKRERVKFVLTSDILYIFRQLKNQGSEELGDRFKEMCIDAFKTLRSKGNLFITVFAMLLSTGIPELEQPNDLDYLRDSLAMLKDEADAVRHFESSYREAHANRSLTTVNWMFHNLNHYWIG